MIFTNIIKRKHLCLLYFCNEWILKVPNGFLKATLVCQTASNAPFTSLVHRIWCFLCGRRTIVLFCLPPYDVKKNYAFCTFMRWLPLSIIRTYWLFDKIKIIIYHYVKDLLHFFWPCHCSIITSSSNGRYLSKLVFCSHLRSNTKKIYVYMCFSIHSVIGKILKT